MSLKTNNENKQNSEKGKIKTKFQQKLFETCVKNFR